MLLPVHAALDGNLGPLTMLIYFAKYHDTEKDEMQETTTEIADANYAANLKNLYHALSVWAGVGRRLP